MQTIFPNKDGYGRALDIQFKNYPLRCQIVYIFMIITLKSESWRSDNHRKLVRTIPETLLIVHSERYELQEFEAECCKDWLQCKVENLLFPNKFNVGSCHFETTTFFFQKPTIHGIYYALNNVSLDNQLTRISGQLLLHFWEVSQS